jgi:hypothetical protein
MSLRVKYMNTPKACSVNYMSNAVLLRDSRLTRVSLFHGGARNSEQAFGSAIPVEGG